MPDLPDFLVRLCVIPEQGMIHVETRDAGSRDYQVLGFTTMERIQEQLQGICDRGGAEFEVPRVLKFLTELGKHQLRFDALRWDSYEAFRNFWQAGIVKSASQGDPQANVLNQPRGFSVVS